MYIYSLYMFRPFRDLYLVLYWLPLVYIQLFYKYLLWLIAVSWGFTLARLYKFFLFCVSAWNEKRQKKQKTCPGIQKTHTHTFFTFNFLIHNKNDSYIELLVRMFFNSLITQTLSCTGMLFFIYIPFTIHPLWSCYKSFTLVYESLFTIYLFII